MEVEFDPAKDAISIAKHGISLARAVELEMADFFKARRIAYGEVRYIGFGLLDGLQLRWPSQGRDQTRSAPSVFGAPI